MQQMKDQCDEVNRAFQQIVNLAMRTVDGCRRNLLPGAAYVKAAQVSNDISSENAGLTILGYQHALRHTLFGEELPQLFSGEHGVVHRFHMARNNGYLGSCLKPRRHPFYP
jgi:hypothetical protein